MEIIGVIIFGAIFGSFLNVCIDRIPTDTSIIFPGSHCPKCKAKISWYDNIPIISYIILKGKCRHCEEDIGIKCLLIEIFTSLIFLILFLEYGLSFSFLKYIIFACFLIVISLIDINTGEVCDKVSYTMIGVGFIFALLEGVPEKYFIGAAVYNFPFLILYSASGLIVEKFKKISKNNVDGKVMGLGDVDVGIGIGAFLGYTNFMSFYRFFLLSFSLGAIISLILIAFKIKKRDDAIQFVPFISLAAFIMVLL